MKFACDPLSRAAHPMRSIEWMVMQRDNRG